MCGSVLSSRRLDLTLPPPPPEEAPQFYKDFLAAFPDGRVGMHLQKQAVELEALCAGLSESGAMFRYAEGKWTVKEVIGHLLDSERVFAYRLLRISRGDVTELPGFDETTYAPEGQFNLRSVEELVSEFKLQRASTLALVNGIPRAAWAPRRDCEWCSHERSGPGLRHSGAHRAPLSSAPRALSVARDPMRPVERGGCANRTTRA